MSLFTGATTIDAVYVGDSAGSGGSTVTPTFVNYTGSTTGENNGAATIPAHQAGDLLLLTLFNSEGSIAAAPAGWTFFRGSVLDNGGLGSKGFAAIYYRIATGPGTAPPTVTGKWMVQTFSGVDRDNPFGAYNVTATLTKQNQLTAPAITLSKPDGYGMALHVFTVFDNSGAGNITWGDPPAGWLAASSKNSSRHLSQYRSSRTPAAVGTSTAGQTGSNTESGWAHSIELLSGSISTVKMAQAVYLGTEKVWPTFVGQLSPWYTLAANGAVTSVPWPFGAEFVDVILIGGGAGGHGTGVGGNPQIGGGAGQWGGRTYSRVDGSLTYTGLQLNVVTAAGTDGAGGGNFNTQAADGSGTRVTPITATGYGAFYNAAGGLDKTSTTGNRNGGSVLPSFTFNGRTYTVASYGAGAGQGGASSNKNGSVGAVPGGGGQSADNGGLTGYNGGNGAPGAAILYWY